MLRQGMTMKRLRVLAIAVAVAFVPALGSAQTLNINKDRIQFSDGTQQSSAATVTSTRTVTVSPVVGNIGASGQNFIDAIAAITSAADANLFFPYLVIIEPGLYNVGATNTTLPQYVSLRGAGQGRTTILGNPTTGAVLTLVGSNRISDLSVAHGGAAARRAPTTLIGSPPSRQDGGAERRAQPGVRRPRCCRGVPADGGIILRWSPAGDAPEVGASGNSFGAGPVFSRSRQMQNGAFGA